MHRVHLNGGKQVVPKLGGAAGLRCAVHREKLVPSML
jgi:hypothetical protein